MSTWWRKTSELDRDQTKVIGLSKDGDHLILGPAGCGKTNLLLLRASFLHKSGMTDVKILTFGRVLKEFLAAGAANYPFSPDKIQTYLNWGIALLTSNGLKFDSAGEFPEVRLRLLESLKDLAKEGRKENIVDCILLDEAQDYSGAEIEVIRQFADQIYAVGDERQRITDVTGGLAALEKFCGDPIVLVDHYRNGLKICRVADGIRNMIDHEEGMEATSKYKEHEYPSSVRTFGSIELDQQSAIAIDEIKTQLVAYPGETIGVLCPRQEEATRVGQVLLASEVKNDVQLQNFAGGYAAFDPAKRVIVTTTHGAKGLEFRVLHLLGMDKVKNFKTQKNLSFTGVTRAKTSLSVYHDKELPGYFEKGLTAVSDGLDGDPAIDDLFL